MFHRLVILCGIIACVAALPSGRIVGGEDAVEGQFPHQVSLLVNGKDHNCGGSIISNRFILTAAHCVVDSKGTVVPPKTYQIRVGSLYYNKGGQMYNISKIIAHENYNNPPFINDVALLETDKPIAFSNVVQSIPLATEEVAPDQKVVISGYGRLYTNGPIADILQWNTLRAIDQDTCGNLINMNYASLLCLDHLEGNGACNGDSGGPATYNNTVVGVAGFVVNGCGSGFPDGYAKVSHHRMWILSKMNSSEL